MSHRTRRNECAISKFQIPADIGRHLLEGSYCSAFVVTIPRDETGSSVCMTGVAYSCCGTGDNDVRRQIPVLLPRRIPHSCARIEQRYLGTGHDRIGTLTRNSLLQSGCGMK